MAVRTPHRQFWIHHVSSAMYQSRQREGWLSLKCMFNGSAIYETDDGSRHVVDDSSYLILNNRQPYRVQKRSVTPVETFCVFFAPDFASSVLRALTLPSDALLDLPADVGTQAVRFYQMRHAHDSVVTPRVQRMRRASRRCDTADVLMEENASDLLAAMLRAHRAVGARAERLPYVRPSTRAELYRRVARARDYMHASPARPLQLTDIARVAGMSSYHFLRVFKHAFGETPHQYLTKTRIGKACHLLSTTDRPVTDICMDVGFQSPASFANLFRRHTQMSPTVFRQEYGRTRGIAQLAGQ